jgi:hypothetical protein
VEPPFFWEFSWVTSRLTEAPLALSWGVTPLALVWIPVAVLCGVVLGLSRGGSLRWVEIVAVVAVAGASLAGDFVGLWLCTAVFLALASALGRTQERGGDPPAALSWMQATGWIACGMWMFAFLWMWREFGTFRPVELVEAASAAPEDVSLQAALRLIVVWLGGGTLLLGGVFPTGGWIGGMSRDLAGGWVFGPGRLALACLWMLRTAPLLEIVLPGPSLFTGPAALTALLTAFLALTTDERRSVVGFGACSLAATALAAAGSGHATGAGAGLQLALTTMLIVTALVADRTDSQTTEPSSSPPLPSLPPAALRGTAMPTRVPQTPAQRLCSGLVGWCAVLIVASGVCGQQHGVSAVTAGLSRPIGDDSPREAPPAPESTPDAEVSRLSTAMVAWSFAAAQFLLVCAWTRLVCLEQRGDWSPARRGWPSLLSLAVAAASPWLVRLASESEVVHKLAGPPEFAPIERPVFALGPVGVAGLLGCLVGVVLYRRESPWPERLARRFDSLFRLGRQELYLETFFRRITSTARSFARFWQAVDSPDRTARQHSPLAAVIRGASTRLAPLWQAGGWQPSLLVLATATVLWGALSRDERRREVDEVPPPTNVEPRREGNSQDRGWGTDRGTDVETARSPSTALLSPLPAAVRTDSIPPHPSLHP